MPVDEIKIGRAFVANMLRNRADATIARTIVELGHSLGKKSSLKVSRAGPFARRSPNSDAIMPKGYYLGRPMAIDAFSEGSTTTRAKRA